MPSLEDMWPDLGDVDDSRLIREWTLRLWHCRVSLQCSQTYPYPVNPHVEH